MRNIFRYSTVLIGLGFSELQAQVPEPSGTFVRQSFQQSAIIEMLDAHALTRIVYKGPFSLMADPHPRMIWQEGPSGASSMEWLYFHDPRAKFRLFISPRPLMEWTEELWQQWQGRLLAAMREESEIEILSTPLEDNPMSGPVLGMLPILYAVRLVIPGEPFAWICEEYRMEAPHGEGSWLLRFECPEPLYPVVRQEVTRLTGSWTIREDIP